MAFKKNTQFSVYASDVAGEKPEPLKTDVGKLFFNTKDKVIYFPYFDGLIPKNMEFNTGESQAGQYMYFVDGDTKYRIGTRDGVFVTDKTLTPTGWDGEEDTDWENVVN